jgi:hypothetical protein
MSTSTMDEALEELGRRDPSFNEGIRTLLRPVRDRFFARPPGNDSDKPSDGFYTAPLYMTDPELRQVAIDLAEFALKRGIDVNLAWESNGTTFLHYCVLLRDLAVASDNVTWLLAHGADPNRAREDGQTPYSLAVKYARTELVELMRAYGGRD